MSGPEARAPVQCRHVPRPARLPLQRLQPHRPPGPGREGRGLRPGRGEPVRRHPGRTTSHSIPSAACRPWSMTASCSTRPAPSPAMSTAPSPGRRCSRATPQALARMDQFDRHHRFLRLLADGPAGLLPSRLPGRGRPAGRRGGDRARPRRAPPRSWPLSRRWRPSRFLPDPSCRLPIFIVGAMIAYFTLAPEGAALLAKYPRLAALVGQTQRTCRASRRPIPACRAAIASPMRERICFET